MLREPPRSLLFVPGDRAVSWAEKASTSGADGVIFDLEDGVAISQKEGARHAVQSARSAVGAEMWAVVRVNPVGTPWFEADVAMAVRMNVAAIVLAKCDGPEDVATLSSHLGDARVAIIPMIEGPAAVLHSESIARSDDRVVGIAFGAEDLRAKIGPFGVSGRRGLSYARSHVVLAAAAAGRWALDSPCLQPSGIEATRREAIEARANGYVGKLVIHPAQVAPVHAAFAPSPSELAAAQLIIDSYADLLRRGIGVGTVGGQMIDAPVVSAAEQLIRRGARSAMRRNAIGRR